MGSLLESPSADSALRQLQSNYSDLMALFNQVLALARFVSNAPHDSPLRPSAGAEVPAKHREIRAV
jgi:hypothetical protein